MRTSRECEEYDCMCQRGGTDLSGVSGVSGVCGPIGMAKRWILCARGVVRIYPEYLEYPEFVDQ